MASMILMGLPEDPAVLAAIGRIAIRHGQLDYSLRMTVKSLTGVSILEALDGTARQGSRELRERIKKIARKRLGEGDVLVRLCAILERSQRATDRRNDLLHVLWCHELDGGPVIRTERHAFATIPTIEELDAVADELHKVANDLNFARLDGFLKDALNS